MLDQEARARAVKIAALDEEFDKVAQLVATMSLDEVESFLASTEEEGAPVSSGWTFGSFIYNFSGGEERADRYQMLVDMDEARSSAWRNLWLTTNAVNYWKPALMADAHVISTSNWQGRSLRVMDFDFSGVPACENLYFTCANANRRFSPSPALHLLVGMYQQSGSASASSRSANNSSLALCLGEHWKASLAHDDGEQLVEAEIDVPAYVVSEVAKPRKRPSRRRPAS